jgi:hypothetical protein
MASEVRDEGLCRAALPALKAVDHILNLTRDRPNLAYEIGYGTQALELLCAAQASYQGREAKDVKQERLASFSREKPAESMLRELKRAAQAVCDASEGGQQAAIDRLRLMIAD